MRFPGGEVLIGYGYDAGAFSGRRCWPRLPPCMLCACKRRQLPRKDEMSAGAGAQIQPSLAAIREAQKFLAQYFAETRLIAGPFLSQRTAKNVYLKLETELPTASFKVRGAFYALAQRMKKEAVREVIASSTGNHGAAVAYAGKEFGIAARIFLPANCNPVKRGRIAALGAALVERGGGGLGSGVRAGGEYGQAPGGFFFERANDFGVPPGPAAIGRGNP